MKAIFAALASATLLAGAMSSISTPAVAQSHGGGFHGGGGGGFHGGGGGFHGGGFHGGGIRGGGFHGSDRGFHDGGFRGGHRHDGDDRLGFVFGFPYGDAYYDDPNYYYDDPYGYDDSGAPACGSWTWDPAHGRYDWIPC